MFGRGGTWTRPCRAAARRAARYEGARALQAQARAQSLAKADVEVGQREGVQAENVGCFRMALCVYRGGAQRSVVLGR